MHQDVRTPVDTVGFATTAAQMDAVVERLGTAMSTPTHAPWRLAVAPHDDYAYVGDLYPASLAGVRAQTVILFGVAHKARMLGLEDNLLFDDFAAWSGPYGPVPVSQLRDEMIARLDPAVFRRHREMHAIEHSIEAIVPFLQHRRRDLEIVPVLAPAMRFDRMREVARELARSIAEVIAARSLRWGREIAIVVSNDAVHYGDDGWGGRDFARFGVGEEGYRRAVEYEKEIIEECLLGALSESRIERFTRHTVDERDHREYRWTWCGRYAVPVGLLTALELQKALDAPPLRGELLGYGTSVDGRSRPRVDDLGMGVTAAASLRHWVGYVGVGYR